MPESTVLSIRLNLPNGTRFGPGKAQLLGSIDQTGSISGAARLLGMSYPRALRLVNEMNSQFEKPLVEKFQGGANRGGATLTDAGKDIYTLYMSIVRCSTKSTHKQTKTLSHLASFRI